MQASKLSTLSNCRPFRQHLVIKIKSAGTEAVVMLRPEHMTYHVQCYTARTYASRTTSAILHMSLTHGMQDGWPCLVYAICTYSPPLSAMLLVPDQLRLVACSMRA